MTSVSLLIAANSWSAYGCVQATRFGSSGCGAHGTVISLTPLAVSFWALCPIWSRVAVSCARALSIRTDLAAVWMKFSILPGSVSSSLLVAFFTTWLRKTCWRLIRPMSLPSP